MTEVQPLSPQDRWEIHDVLARYCVALDTRDWDMLKEVFTETAVCDYGKHGQPSGMTAIVDRLRTALQPFDVTQHLIGTSLVTATPAGAHGRTYLVAQHTRRGAPDGENYTIAGTYLDELVRTPGGWRITHRTLSPAWTEGAPPPKA